MIRFRLQELLAEKQFKDGRRVTLTELAGATGISRITLSKMVNVRGYGTLTDHLDRLCRFFQCDLSALAQYLPDEEIGSPHSADGGATARKSGA
jgi:putative transcriptional regulator